MLPEDQSGMCTQSGAAGNLSTSDPGCDTNRCKVCKVTLIALIDGGVEGCELIVCLCRGLTQILRQVTSPPGTGVII